MENLTDDTANYIKNEMRLLETKAENNVLLRQINRLETKINRAKQQLKQPRLNDVQVLNELVHKSLYLLAEKDTITVIGNKPPRLCILHRLIDLRHQYLSDKFRTRLYYRQRPVYRLCHL